MDSFGEPPVPHKGLDCYLDSLFDPVLSYGDAVGMGGDIPGPVGGMSCLDLCRESAKDEGVLSARDAIVFLWEDPPTPTLLWELARHPHSLWELPGAPPWHEVQP